MGEIVLELGGGAGNAGPFVLAQPAPTISTADGQGVGSSYARDVLEGQIGRRRLTIAECATLQDFPPDHPWQGTKADQYRQVGNAVPPTLARVVIESIMRAAL